MQAYAEGFEIMKAATRVRPRPARDRQHLALRLGRALLAARPDRAGAGRRRRRCPRSRAGSTTPARAAGRWRRRSTGPCPRRSITASLFTRFASREPDAYQAKLLAAMRNQFGGHAIHLERAAGDGTRRARQLRRSATCTVFGASGDLTARKLLPALAGLADQGLLTDELRARRRGPHPDVRRRSSAPTSTTATQATADAVEAIVAPGPLHRRRLRRPGDLRAAGRRSSTSFDADGTEGNRLYYLAAVPDVFPGSSLRWAPPASARRRVHPGGHREAVRPRPGQRASRSTSSATSTSTSARSTGSTTTWGRRRSRTSSPCASPTRSSNRSGTAGTSTTCRSPSPSSSASRAGPASTSRRAPCATSSRTI